MVARTWPPSCACGDLVDLVPEPGRVPGFLFVFVDMLHKLYFLD